MVREVPLTSWVVALKGLVAGSFILGSIINPIWFPFRIILFIAAIVIVLDSAIPYGRPNHMATLSILFILGIIMAYATWMLGYGMEWLILMVIAAILVYLYRGILRKTWKKGGKLEPPKEEEEPEEKGGKPSPAEMEQAKEKLEEVEEKREKAEEKPEEGKEEEKEEPAEEPKEEEPEPEEKTEEAPAEEEKLEEVEESQEEKEEPKEEAEEKEEPDSEEEETEEEKEIRKNLKKVLE
ncbi:MAG: hypothetical protein V3V26_02680 [Candidatus Aenigmarchaeota archaeon]